MKKILWMLAVVVTMISSCDINIDPSYGGKENKGADPTAVGFNVYVNRGLQTKAGWGGVLTLAELKDEANGFGVFAYYGNGALYNETMMPDFMYDQQVCFTDNNVWEYSPIKYWPNEYGEAASSEAADRLTFFAYAPFADVTPSTGVVTDGSTTGIIGMSRNISKGDPVVMYSSSLTPGNGVDLCWGVAAEAFTSSVDGDNNNVAAGYPFINVIKPKTGDHLKFEFNHALAQLNVQIDADINNEGSGDNKTKIYVRSVTFNGFSMRGSLNLNSNKTEGPIWYDISGTGKLKREPVTVYDGRTDGMEGVATATDVSEKPADLNPVLVQSKPYGATGQTVGVTNEAANMFNNADAEAPVMVIPTPGVPMSVTIVYDVETEDGRLAGYLSDGVTHGSSVENKITKTITTSEGNMILSAGKKYVVKLHLGLTSVKFDADVAIWDNTTYPDPVDVNLPDNSGVTPPTPTAASFRGYEISKGVLKKESTGFVLTPGDDQLETVAWIGIDGSQGVYYHQWTQLKAALGSDGNNIMANSDALPSGWSMPSYNDWKNIMGNATGITINGESVDYGYALVQVTGVQVAGNTTDLPGILLLPDETDISCINLKKEYIGPGFGHDAAFARNLTVDDIASLTVQDCLFLPFTGEYGLFTNGQGDDEYSFAYIAGGADNQIKVDYLSCTGFLDTDDDTFVYTLYGYVDTAFWAYDPDDYDPDDVDTWLYYTKVSGYWISYGDQYHPVRLVKKIN